MRTQKRFLIALVAVAAAGLVGCLNSPDSAPSASAPVTEAEIQAAITGDSLHPVRPAVCDSLKARLAGLDSTAANYDILRKRIAHACAIRPVPPPRPDSLRPDSLRPRPDSLRPVPPVKPDSGRPNLPKPPQPPKLPRK